jgi:predicted DNA-binding protein (MmcQ/YjbR family)
MMDRAAFDALCQSLPATFMVVQWGEAHVWKVGDRNAKGKNKVFAMSTFWLGKDGEGADDAKNGQHGIVLKVAPMSFEMLTAGARHHPGALHGQGAMDSRGGRQSAER